MNCSDSWHRSGTSLFLDTLACCCSKGLCGHEAVIVLGLRVATRFLQTFSVAVFAGPSLFKFSQRQTSRLPKKELRLLGFHYVSLFLPNLISCVEKSSWEHLLYLPDVIYSRYGPHQLVCGSDLTEQEKCAGRLFRNTVLSCLSFELNLYLSLFQDQDILKAR